MQKSLTRPALRVPIEFRRNQMMRAERRNGGGGSKWSAVTGTDVGIVCERRVCVSYGRVARMINESRSHRLAPQLF